MRQVEASGQRLAGTEHLGRGEAEALKLATQIRADLLRTDDKQARRAAEQFGLQFTGLLGVVVDAKQRGHIDSVSALIAKLQQQGGLYLSESVRAEALKMAGEG